MSDTTDAFLDLLSKHAPGIVSMLQQKQSDRMEVFRKAFDACETSTQKTDLAIAFFETSGAGFGTPEAIQQAMAAAQGGAGAAPSDDDSTHEAPTTCAKTPSAKSGKATPWQSRRRRRSRATGAGPLEASSTRR